MNFSPHISHITTVLDEYNKIVESERMYHPKIGHDLPTTLENGELVSHQAFSPTRTELEMRLSLLRPHVTPFLSLQLRFLGDDKLTRGAVALKATPEQHPEYGWGMNWEISAERHPPQKLPRDAERLVSRLRGYERTKRKYDYASYRKQLVSTLFIFAVQGVSSLG